MQGKKVRDAHNNASGRKWPKYDKGTLFFVAEADMSSVEVVRKPRRR